MYVLREQSERDAETARTREERDNVLRHAAVRQFLLKKELDAEVLRLYRLGWGMYEIGLEVGTHADDVRKIVEQHWEKETANAG
jgi:hypothetical protein